VSGDHIIVTFPSNRYYYDLSAGSVSSNIGTVQIINHFLTTEIWYYIELTSTL
jgi:hypothetical protein